MWVHLRIANYFEFFENDKLTLQCLVIYAGLFFSRLASAAIVIAWLTLKEERSQKIDDLPLLATCHSHTSAMLSSEVNGPIAHGSTQ